MMQVLGKVLLTVLIAILFIPLANAEIDVTGTNYTFVPGGSFFLDSFILSNAFDKDFQTVTGGDSGENHAATGDTTDDTDYIQVTLPSIVNLSHLYFKASAYVSVPSNPDEVTIKIKVSSNNTTWTTLQTFTSSAPYNNPDIWNTNYTNVQNVKYIRTTVYRSSASNDVYFRWYEIQALTSEETVSLFSPTNNSIIYKTYPPLTVSINFTWSKSTLYSSNFIIARDSSFNLISVDTTTSNNFSVQQLAAGTYYWKVRYYNAASGTYYNWSETFKLMIQDQTTTDNTAGIHGVIYEKTSAGVDIPISGALVTITDSNLNWTSSMITGSNGYYSFSNLSVGSIYAVRATKVDQYQDSNIEYVTTQAGTWITKNIYMQRCVSGFNCFYNQHYVKFNVRKLACIWDCDYVGVTVTVYKGSDVVPLYTDTTKSDGSVTFLLIKDQSYRITFVNTTLGINYEKTLIPHDDEYIIMVPTTQITWQDYPVQQKDAINITVSQTVLNSTHAQITVTYLDTSNGTSNLTIYLNQSGGLNQTMIDSWNGGATNNTSHTFTVSGYNGQSYLIRVVATHSTYGTIDNSYSVVFRKTTAITGIPDLFWFIFAVGSLVFLGAIFTGTTAEKGLLIVCGIAWVYFAMGFFNYVNSAQVAISITVASIFAVMVNIGKWKKTEGYA